MKNIYTAGHAMDVNLAHALYNWITKATKTHSEYVILLVFPQLQWLHGTRINVTYRYIACLAPHINKR